MTATITRTGQNNISPPPPMTSWQREKAYGPVLPMQKDKKWWQIWN